MFYSKLFHCRVFWTSLKKKKLSKCHCDQRQPTKSPSVVRTAGASATTPTHVKNPPIRLRRCQTHRTATIQIQSWRWWNVLMHKRNLLICLKLTLNVVIFFHRRSTVRGSSSTWKTHVLTRSVLEFRPAFIECSYSVTRNNKKTAGLELATFRSWVQTVHALISSRVLACRTASHLKRAALLCYSSHYYSITLLLNIALGKTIAWPAGVLDRPAML